MWHSLVSSVLVGLLSQTREGSSPFLNEALKDVGISGLLLLKKYVTDHAHRLCVAVTGHLQ